jgi:hypothetical protein
MLYGKTMLESSRPLAYAMDVNFLHKALT